MARLRDRRPHRDEPCPGRVGGLTHVQDGSYECVYCHQQTRSSSAGLISDPAPEPAEAEAEPPIFTDAQVRRLEFLRWLWLQGRV